MINPVVYMSRETAAGRTQVEILFDDRMAPGEMRLEEDPNTCQVDGQAELPLEWSDRAGR